MGLSIIYFKEYPATCNYVRQPLKIVFILPNSAEALMKYHVLPHFIWDFTVCQSNPVEVSSIHMANNNSSIYNSNCHCSLCGVSGGHMMNL